MMSILLFLLVLFGYLFFRNHEQTVSIRSIGQKRKFKETKDFLTVKDWKSSHQFGQLAHLKRTCLTMYLLEFSIISKKGWSSFWLTGSSVVKTNAQIDRFSTLIKVRLQFTILVSTTFRSSFNFLEIPVHPKILSKES